MIGAPAVRRIAAGLTLAVILAACTTAGGGSSQATGPLGLTEAPPPPELDQERIGLGETLYQQKCASCHGPDLSGDPDWKTANADGSYPPPPHDSSGHTWHHSDEVLNTLIRDGSDFPQTRMPTFGQTLSDQEITAILEYLKSRWGPEERAYQWQITWQERDR